MAKKGKRKAKPARKGQRVKIAGDPFTAMRGLFTKGGSSRPKRRGA